MKTVNTIGKLLPKEVREKPAVKIGLGIFSIGLAAYSIYEVFSKGKLTATSVISAVSAITTFNEALDDIEEGIEEQKV